MPNQTAHQCVPPSHAFISICTVPGLSDRMSLMSSYVLAPDPATTTIHSPLLALCRSYVSILIEHALTIMNQGGAISMSGGSLTIESSTFTSNSAVMHISHVGLVCVFQCEYCISYGNLE